MLRKAKWNYSRAISKIDHCVFGLQPSVMQKMQPDAGQNAFNSQVSTHAKLQVTSLCEYWQRNRRLTGEYLLNGNSPRYEIEKSIKQLSYNTDGPSCQKLIIVPLQSYRSELLLTLFYKMISTVRKSKVPRNKTYLYKTCILKQVLSFAFPITDHLLVRRKL